MSKKTGEFDKTEYDVGYNKEHVTRKFLPFNDQNPRDVRLLEWVKRQGNFTQYIKDLIERDMEEKKET